MERFLFANYDDIFNPKYADMFTSFLNDDNEEGKWDLLEKPKDPSVPIEKETPNPVRLEYNEWPNIPIRNKTDRVRIKIKDGKELEETPVVENPSLDGPFSTLDETKATIDKSTKRSEPSTKRRREKSSSSNEKSILSHVKTVASKLKTLNDVSNLAQGIKDLVTSKGVDLSSYQKIAAGASGVIKTIRDFSVKEKSTSSVKTSRHPPLKEEIKDDKTVASDIIKGKKKITKMKDSMSVKYYKPFFGFKKEQRNRSFKIPVIEIKTENPHEETIKSNQNQQENLNDDDPSVNSNPFTDLSISFGRRFNRAQTILEDDFKTLSNTFEEEKPVIKEKEVDVLKQSKKKAIKINKIIQERRRVITPKRYLKLLRESGKLLMNDRVTPGSGLQEKKALLPLDNNENELILNREKLQNEIEEKKLELLNFDNELRQKETELQGILSAYDINVPVGIITPRGIPLQKLTEVIAKTQVSRVELRDKLRKFENGLKYLRSELTSEIDLKDNEIAFLKNNNLQLTKRGEIDAIINPSVQRPLKILQEEKRTLLAALHESEKTSQNFFFNLKNSEELLSLKEKELNTLKNELKHYLDLNTQLSGTSESQREKIATLIPNLENSVMQMEQANAILRSNNKDLNDFVLFMTNSLLPFLKSTDNSKDHTKLAKNALKNLDKVLVELGNRSEDILKYLIHLQKSNLPLTDNFFSSLKNTSTPFKQMVSQLHIIEKELDSKKTQLISNKQTIKHMANQIEEGNMKNKKIKEKSKALSLENDKISNNVKELTHQIESFKYDNEFLLRQVMELNDDNKAFIERLADIEPDNMFLNNSLQKELARSLQLEYNLDGIVKETNEMNSYLEQIKAAKKLTDDELAYAITRINDFKMSNEKLSNALNEVKQQYAALNADYNTISDKYKSYEHVDTIKDYLALETSEINELLIKNGIYALTMAKQTSDSYRAFLDLIPSISKKYPQLNKDLDDVIYSTTNTLYYEGYNKLKDMIGAEPFDMGIIYRHLLKGYITKEVLEESDKQIIADVLKGKEPQIILDQTKFGDIVRALNAIQAALLPEIAHKIMNPHHKIDIEGSIASILNKSNIATNKNTDLFGLIWERVYNANTARGFLATLAYVMINQFSNLGSTAKSI
ncbi:MAG: hypothetical protein RIR01_1606 [Bacteroidota bacterium]